MMQFRMGSSNHVDTQRSNLRQMPLLERGSNVRGMELVAQSTNQKGNSNQVGNRPSVKSSQAHRNTDLQGKANIRRHRPAL